MLTTRCRHRFAGFLLACWAVVQAVAGAPVPGALEVQRICSAQAPGQWRLVLPLDAPEAPSSVHAPDCLLCLPPLWLGPPAAHAMVLAPASAAPAAPRRRGFASRSLPTGARDLRLERERDQAARRTSASAMRVIAT